MKIQWTKYKKDVRGRDPLGVQAIGIHLYALLVPGITNVTDRFRYYSFYPWLLKMIEQEGGTDDFLLYLRRGEFLFGLISHVHDNEVQSRSAHVVGTMVMGKAVSELESKGSISLSKYTNVDSDLEYRYFKNPLGGLGQYYLGPLGELGILSREDKKFSLYPRGQSLAQAFEPGSCRETFWKCVQTDKLSFKALLELRKFFPASLLEPGSKEYELLKDYLFSEDSPEVQEGDRTYRRRDTLRLLLLLLQEVQGEYVDWWEPLNILFYGLNSKGKKFAEPAELKEVADLWRYYLKHEHFSIGLSTISVCLQELIQKQSIPERSIASVCWEKFIKKTPTPGLPKQLIECYKLMKKNPSFETFLDVLKTSYSRKTPWDDDSLSEYSLWKVIRQREPAFEDLLGVGVILILMQVINDQFSPEKIIGQQHFERLIGSYPVNLRLLEKDVSSRWNKLSLQEVISDIIRRYVVQRHLEVATMKHFSHGLSTFRFVREQGMLLPTGLEIDYIAGTSPRLNQSLQYLADLGFVVETKQGFKRGDSKRMQAVLGELKHGS